MPRSLSPFVLAGALLATPGVIAQTVVVPNGLETIEGNSSNSLPFQCRSDSYLSVRYQQVYAGTEVGAGLLGEMRLRQDPVATSFTNTLSGVTITLSSTAHAPDALSSTFDLNEGDDATNVFSGSLVLSNVASAGGTSPFTIVIPFRPSFPFDPDGGLNLLVDVTIPTCPDVAEPAKSFDAEDLEGDAVSRAVGGAFSPTAVLRDSLGLVTQFHFHVFADGFESGNLSAWSAASF